MLNSQSFQIWRHFLYSCFRFTYICVQSFSEGINDWEDSDQIRIRAKAARKYAHTIEELQLTKEVPIIDPKPCNNVHPISVFVLSAGRSSGKYFEKREAVRNTWVQEMKDLKITVYFAIAKNRNETINEELKEESDKHQDIIQFQFIDAYYNLTLKTISIIRWVNKKCLNSSYILKADDDVIVNVGHLLDICRNWSAGFRGLLYRRHGVSRDPEGIIELFIWKSISKSYLIFRSSRQMAYPSQILPQWYVPRLWIRNVLYYGSKYHTISIDGNRLLFWLRVRLRGCSSSLD